MAENKASSVIGRVNRNCNESCNQVTYYILLPVSVVLVGDEIGIQGTHIGHRPLHNKNSALYESPVKAHDI